MKYILFYFNKLDSLIIANEVLGIENLPYERVKINF